MSLSQQHPGKVLVPWLNIAEWKKVNNLIYSSTASNWRKALEIIKIWKQRTPLLSAGVIGTLIVLEALLVDSKKLSEYEFTHIYSTSLVRFLNLCAAISDRQGTFYKVAMENKLPTWLINVRHEIAHGHKVPSKCILKLSINFCLNWLKEHYWDVQSSLISEFIVEKPTSKLQDDSIYIYLHLSSILFNKTQVNRDRELTNRIYNFQRKLKIKFDGDYKNTLELTEKILFDNFRNNPEHAVNSICEILIDNCLMLSVECDIDSKGRKQIPQNFIKIWVKLLNIIYINGTLLYLINNLFDFVMNEDVEMSFREVASLWLHEIYLGLLNQGKNEKTVEGITFNCAAQKCKDHNFVSRVLEEVTPFTLNFVNEVLKYHDASPSFVEDAIQTITAYTIVTEVPNGRIYTVDDINFDLPKPASKSTHENSIGDPENQQNVGEVFTGWKCIEDTEPFTNLPLGMLPNQLDYQNPILNSENK